MENKHTGALSGVGFYATLVICLLAVGVGGYFLLFGGQETAQEEEEQKAAWEFIKFLCSDDNAAKWVAGTPDGGDCPGAGDPGGGPGGDRLPGGTDGGRAPGGRTRPGAG